MTDQGADPIQRNEALPLSCWIATLVLTTGWLWYQTTVDPFVAVVGLIDQSRINRLISPPLSPLYLAIGLGAFYSLCRTSRPLGQRLVFLCMLLSYSWTLLRLLHWADTPTMVPIVFITKTSHAEQVCGLLIEESSTSDRIWYAQAAIGYTTEIAKSQIRSVQYGPASDLLKIALRAADNDLQDLPDCSAVPLRGFTLAQLKKLVINLVISS